MAERRAKRWWEADKRSLAASIFSTADRFDDQDGDRRLAMSQWLDIYNGVNSTGLGSSIRQARFADAPWRIQLNASRAAVNTLCAKVAKAQPATDFLTDGASRSKQQRARNLRRFVAGQYEQTGTYRVTPRVLKSAAIFGKAHVKVAPAHACLGRIMVERLFPDEVLVDELEAKHGEPRQMMQRVPYSRDVLKALFPDKKDELDKALEAEEYRSKFDADMVWAIEAWHLKSGPNAKDGRRVVAVSSAVLDEERWDEEAFPIIGMDYDEPEQGYWGQGIIEQAAPLQAHLDELVEQLQESIYFMVPKLLAHTSANVNPAAFNDEIMSLIKWSGDPSMKPELVVWQTVSPVLVGRIREIVEDIFRMAGISLLAARAEKPAGLDSGEALQTYHDIETERFVMLGKQYEQLHLDISKQMIRCAKSMDEKIRDERKERGKKYDGPEEYFVNALGKDSLEKLRWKDVEIDEADYAMRPAATSLVPADKSGRLSTLERLIKMQVIRPENVRGLIRDPDLEADRSLDEAEKDYVLYQIDAMLDAGDEQLPEPAMDYERAADLALRAYFEAKRQGVSAARLDLVLQYATAAREMGAALAAANAPPPPPMGGLPPELGAGPMPGGPMPGPMLPPPTNGAMPPPGMVQ